MSFDANVRLASGSGLVARRGDAVLVLPGGSERDGGLLSRFLEPTAENRIDAVTECAEDADEALPPFICISWERRLRVVVYGDAELVTDHPALPMMSGAGSGTWVERSLSKVSGAIRIDVCCAVEAALPWTDLGSGVVAAAGASIMLTPSVAGAEESERPTAVTGSEMVTPVAPVTQVPPPLVAPVRSPSEQVADERRAVNGQPAVARHNDFLDDVFAEPIAPSGPAVPPARSTADLLVDDLLGSSSPTPRPPDPPSPSPAPVPPTPTPTPTPLDEELTFVPAAKPDVAEMVRHHATETGAPGRPTIEASTCQQCDAPNPTTASRCQVCDALMPPTSETRFVPRPALGRIVFDDGTVETLDVGLLLGRNPRREETLEECRVVKLSGEKLSRLHAEIQLRNWDVFVVDRGSTNGTFVVPYPDAAPLRIESEVMHRIEPGALVFLGTCAFRLESRRAEGVGR